jgi:two-component system LytT family response regulator
MPAIPKNLTAVIVDDEQLARTVVREHLSSHSEIEILAECANGFEAVKQISELKPDLLFLDIQMPKLNGFEVLELVDHSPAVIFVTAYDQYALKAFDVHAVDYLLKPFTRERFEEALQRAISHVGRTDLSLHDLVREVRDREQPLERILIKEGSTVRVLASDSIDYVEAQDDYISFHVGGKQFLKHQTLSDLEPQLDDARFVRIHRSYILNIDRLSKLEPYSKDNRMAVLKDGTQLPVSRTGYDRLKGLL